MRVLALDTTTRALSAAVVDDDRVLAEHLGDAARTHAERLPGDLLALLGEAGVEMAAIDLFAVAAGPGSFTGLRTGIATMQGLALVRRRRIVALSALEALAYAAARQGAAPGTTVASWIDARRGDVFGALYRIEAAVPFSTTELTAIEAPAVQAPSVALDRWKAGGLPPDLFIGSGALLHAGVITGAGYGRILPPPPLAAIIGRAAMERARAGDTVDPGGVQPLYIRRPDAEVARDTDQPQRTQR
jgi:tRNA threonylcarbamoyladenosine biosynthesis protein TsaB